MVMPKMINIPYLEIKNYLLNCLVSTFFTIFNLKDAYFQQPVGNKTSKMLAKNTDIFFPEQSIKKKKEKNTPYYFNTGLYHYFNNGYRTDETGTNHHGLLSTSV